MRFVERLLPHDWHKDGVLHALALPHRGSEQGIVADDGALGLAIGELVHNSCQ